MFPFAFSPLEFLLPSIMQFQRSTGRTYVLPHLPIHRPPPPSPCPAASHGLLSGAFTTPVGRHRGLLNAPSAATAANSSWPAPGFSSRRHHGLLLCARRPPAPSSLLAAAAAYLPRPRRACAAASQELRRRIHSSAAGSRCPRRLSPARPASAFARARAPQHGRSGMMQWICRAKRRSATR